MGAEDQIGMGGGAGADADHVAGFVDADVLEAELGEEALNSLPRTSS